MEYSNELLLKKIIKLLDLFIQIESKYLDGIWRQVVLEQLTPIKESP